MPDNNLFPVPKEVSQRAWVTDAKYKAMYAESVANPDEFWGEHGKRLHWIKPYTKVKNTSFAGDVRIKWFEDGTLNAAYNCVDRHLATARRPDRDPVGGRRSRAISNTSPMPSCTRMSAASANVLKSHGVKKGDRVTIYMPMIPETAYAMLACARIGAVHSVVFGGFSPESLAGRIQDCASTVVHHRRRRAARRPQGAAEGQCRRGAEAVPRGRRPCSW